MARPFYGKIIDPVVPVVFCAAVCLAAHYNGRFLISRGPDRAHCGQRFFIQPWA